MIRSATMGKWSRLAIALLAFFGGATLMRTIPTAHGQAACPPGEIPYGTGTDQSVCGPDDSQSTSSSPRAPKLRPERWQDHWGAIATDEPKGAMGSVVDKTSVVEAEQTALASCRERGGANCKIQISYRNQCVAMVVGGKIFNTNPGNTIEEAVKKGMKMCSADAGDCHVYYSACSLPVRIR